MIDADLPLVPSHAVDRPGLRSRLDRGLTAPLILVVGPAGAGKTVLLSQWVRALPACSAVWFEVSTADAEPVAFARRVVERIRSVVPRFPVPTSPIALAEDRLGEGFLEEVAAGLAAVGEIVLVFDDLELLAGTGVLVDLWRLVDLLPENAHAVFSSRVDLHLGWSRHRLEHGLVELRQHDLAFDSATTADVIARLTGSPVSDEVAAAVAQRAEGWAAGVQLTALSLRGADGPDAFADALADSDRLVVDYFSDEVLGALDERRRESVLRAGVLDRFCAAMIEAVIGVDGERFIAELERDSLFVVPLPGEPGWYRFHHLFRDLLLLRLRGMGPAFESELLERAAEWCGQAGREGEAIEYLLRARDWDRAVDRILALRGDDEALLAAIASWLARVPDAVRAARPEVELLRAIADSLSGRAAAAIGALRVLLAEGGLTVGQRQLALTFLAAAVQFDPRTDMFLEIAGEARDLLASVPDAELPALPGPTARPLLIALSTIALGRAHLLRGDLRGALAALREALGLDGAAYPPLRVHALGSLAIAEALSGRLVAASRHGDDALAVAGGAGLVTDSAPADALIAHAIVAVQRGVPKRADLALVDGAARAQANGRTQLMWVAHLAARMAGAAVAPVTEPEGSPPPLVRQGLRALAMRRARLDGARGVPQPAPRSWGPVAFESAAALLESGDSAAAREVLAGTRDLDPDSPESVVEHQLLQAWIARVDGHASRCRDHVVAALAVAEPEWLVHPFVRVGAPCTEAVAEIAGTGTDYRRAVVSRLHEEVADAHPADAGMLTAREQELLAYLPTRLTVAGIAARCFVSTNTVKTHLGHIYRKFGVGDRDAAVAHAIEAGLLDPPDIVH